MVVIQQVIVMSSQTLVQSDKAAGPPQEAEYNVVYAAVTATERGRWFLKEFANRNRSADTDLIMAAIARIEAAIASGAAPQAMAEVRDLALAAAVIEPVRAVGERDDDAAAVIAQVAPATDSVPQPQTQSDEDYSEAVAAIAASLTVRLEESVKELTPEGAIAQSVSEDDVADEPARVPQAPSVPAASATARPQMTAAQSRVAQDNTTRWHIEGPDFVFGADDRDDKSAGAAPAGPSPQMHAQLLGAELMAAELVDDAQSAPVVDPALNPVLDAVPVPAASKTPAAETSSPLATPMLDSVPPSEISRPQLRIAGETMPVNQRPLRYGSLTVSDALSEDEVIALFG
jgi:hypothetical protein